MGEIATLMSAVAQLRAEVELLRARLVGGAGGPRGSDGGAAKKKAAKLAEAQGVSAEERAARKASEARRAGEEGDGEAASAERRAGVGEVDDCVVSAARRGDVVDEGSAEMAASTARRGVAVAAASTGGLAGDHGAFDVKALDETNAAEGQKRRRTATPTADAEIAVAPVRPAADVRETAAAEAEAEMQVAPTVPVLVERFEAASKRVQGFVFGGCDPSGLFASNRPTSPTLVEHAAGRGRRIGGEVEAASIREQGFVFGGCSPGGLSDSNPTSPTPFGPRWSPT